ncbi:fatty acid binding protein 7, brain, b [Ictalurus furcatus]|uniref:fatty acid binding protein 7, brain, b n=1 Tax=Ictalurus furcatus TaxID=66913 RepID=UPI0023504334|nr:fatty acid binding protein 7, brain, b [Ictalurus furcatus]
MDAFIGSWKLVKSENFTKYLTALGVREEQIRVAQIIKPTITFYKDWDYIVVKTVTSIHTGEIWFRLGEEYYEKTKDGRQCKNVVTLEGSKLVQVQTWDDKETTFVREISGKNMVMTLTFEDTVATLTYQAV